MKRPGPPPTPAPARAHPLVRQFFDLLNADGMSGYRLEEKTGVSRRCVWGWRVTASNRMRASCPRIDILDACANALGYKLALVPIEKDER